MTTDPREAIERLTRWRGSGASIACIPNKAAARSQFSADVAALLSLVEWRPISEAPKDGTHILFSDEFKNVGICWWENENKRAGKSAGWISDSCIDFGGFEAPTRWMPCPAAPIGGADNGR